MQCHAQGLLENNLHLAKWYMDNGEFPTAIRNYERILEKENVKDEPSVSVQYLCNKFIGECYNNLNNYLKSAVYYEKATEFFHSISVDYKMDCLYIFPTLSDVYISLGEIDKAKKTVNSLWRLVKDGPQPYLDVLEYAMGSFYYSTGDYQTAQGYLYGAFKKSEVAEEASDEYLLNLARLANSCYCTGDYGNALIFYNLLLEENLPFYYFYSGRRHLFYNDALENYAHCMFIGNHSERRVEAILERLFNNKVNVMKENFHSMGEMDRELYYESFDVDISHYIDYYNDGYFNVANILYNTSLLKKGLLLNLSIETGRLIREGGDSELNALYEKLQGIRKKLEYSLPGEDVNALMEEAGKLDNEIAVKLDNSYDLTKDLTISSYDIAARLGKGDAAIEFLDYYRGDTLYYAALVLKNDGFPDIVEICSQEDLLSYGISDTESYDDIGVSRLIWKKVLEKAKASEGGKIYFSAAGDLHKYAIEYLLCEDGKRMNEKYLMYRLSSTREVCRDYKPSPIKKAVLYGGIQYHDSRYKYLPFTKMEVDDISHIMDVYSYPYTLYCGAKGSTASLKSLSGGKYTIMHIATHGDYIQKEGRKKEKVNKPLFTRSSHFNGSSSESFHLEGKSSLLFSDGVMTDVEISYLNFYNTDLAVLSACKTALADVRGDDLFGLQRGFKKAGVQSLIMSLWNVSDEATNYIMSSFYKFYLSGDDKRVAFQKAQAVLRERFPEPIFWAPFILLD